MSKRIPSLGTIGLAALDGFMRGLKVQPFVAKRPSRIHARMTDQWSVNIDPITVPKARKCGRILAQAVNHAKCVRIGVPPLPNMGCESAFVRDNKTGVAIRIVRQYNAFPVLGSQPPGFRCRIDVMGKPAD